jgi:cytochrome c553
MPQRPPVLLAGAWLLGLAATLAGAQPERAPAARGDAAARLAEAQADPRLAETMLRNGRKVAGFCANCHGDNGNSSKPDVPNLAGQNSAYLLEQMRQFAAGARRNEFMEGVIKAMSADERAAIVLFYAAQRVEPHPAADAALTALGADLYLKVCVRCHGAQGLGSEKIPRIAGQQGEYLRLTLKRYRSGTGARTDPLMAANTRLLTDAHIEGLVAYVSTLR